MFWINHYSGAMKGAKIERSTLAGTQRKTIVEDLNSSPISLDIDFDNDRIFWIDPYSKNIYSASLLGDKRYNFQDYFSAANCLSVYGDKIFWVDTTERYIMKSNKTALLIDHVQPLPKSIGDPKKLLIYHKSRQRGNLIIPLMLFNYATRLFN